jgi:hypothetical protein
MKTALSWIIAADCIGLVFLAWLWITKPIWMG